MGHACHTPPWVVWQRPAQKTSQGKSWRQPSSRLRRPRICATGRQIPPAASAALLQGTAAEVGTVCLELRRLVGAARTEVALLQGTAADASALLGTVRLELRRLVGAARTGVPALPRCSAGSGQSAYSPSALPTRRGSLRRPGTHPTAAWMPRSPRRQVASGGFPSCDTTALARQAGLHSR